jgi:hypothetical protein
MAASLASCGVREPSALRGGEVGSMSTCLSRIKEDSGKSVKDIATDRPDKISGFLANGAHFMCEMKTTGKKGTYFEGSYEVKN